jgi:hypothetical protein
VGLGVVSEDLVGVAFETLVSVAFVLALSASVSVPEHIAVCC